MRIGIDIKCLRYNNAGIGRYLRCILDALQRIDNRNEYLLFAPSNTPFEPTAPNFKVKVCKSDIKLPGILWQQSTLPGIIRENDLDIFWGPEQTLPVGNTGKTIRVLTVHDLVYKRYPETMVKSVLWVNKIFGNKSIDVADAIFSDSEFTKNEILHFFPEIDKEKIHVVHCGAAATLVQPTGRKPRQGRLLFVGSLEPRKNLPALVRALEILHADGLDIPLSITGPKGWKNQTIFGILEKSPVAGNITHLGFVSEEELRELYDTCAALVFPSFYEGFGLPVIEALAHRMPVLTTKGSVMEEVAGKFATYFDAGDPQSIANAIRDFWNRRESAEQELLQEESGLEELLHHFSWENTATKLLGYLEELVRNGRRP